MYSISSWIISFQPYKMVQLNLIYSSEFLSLVHI